MRLVVRVEPHRAVITHFDMGSTALEGAEPESEVGVLSAVVPMSDRRRHVDDTIDQFGLFQIWHRLVPPLELGAGQAVAILEWWCRDGHWAGLRDAGVLWSSNRLHISLFQ